uniref:Odorant-binding protein n=1 Tax=Phenacoccus solenopsis TaxID=483260 RepID=A0A0U2UZ81_9HEMI|nr:odorant-binding protein [Phenacoccus solenopsis]
MQKFICVAVAILVISSVAAAFAPNDVHEAAGKCRLENGIQSDAELNNVNDRKVKCYFGCFMREMGMIVNGKVNPDKEIELIKTITPEQYNEEIKAKVYECANITSVITDVCELGMTSYLCVFGKV